jgi:DNA-3-methyladenine glycosylase
VAPVTGDVLGPGSRITRGQPLSALRITPFTGAALPEARGHGAGGLLWREIVLFRQEFFARDTVTVARELVGARLYVVGAQGELCGRIVETEAYLGENDPASHAGRGPTPRCRIMFGPPAVAYVYFIYGVHHCLNFVTEPEGTAGAVLIRALEPVQGHQRMARNRGLDPGRFRDRDLCSGPGKLCQALGIDQPWNGTPLDGSTGRAIWVSPPRRRPADVAATPRIGIRQAADRLFRFTDPASSCLSR